MSRILAIANVKGGVGKTTTVVNLAAALAERGLRVLAIDLDPQSSLTLSIGLKPEQVEFTVRDLMSQATPMANPIHQTDERWDLIPANVNLRILEHELEMNPHQIPKVAAAIQPFRDCYDFILIDCPASTGTLLGAALAAADQVIIPLTPDYLAFEVSRTLFRIIRAVQHNLNPRLRIGGIFLTMYDTRTRHARDFMAQIREAYEDVPFFSAIVRHSVRVKEAPALGKSVLQHAPTSQAARAYRVIAAELVEGIPAPAVTKSPVSAEKGSLAPLMVPTQPPITPQPKASAPKSSPPVSAQSNALHKEPRLPGFLTKAVEVAAVEDIPYKTSSSPLDLAPSRPQEEIHDADYIAYRRATELNPLDVGAWIARAVTARDAYDAIKSWAHALELDPSNEDVEHELDTLLARKLFLATEREIPDLLALANLLADKGLKTRAAQVYSRISELDLECEAAWLGWARVTDDPLERLAFVQRAIQINPSSPDSRTELEYAKLRLKQEAERLLEEGTRAANNRQLAEAHLLFKRAVDLDPSDDRAWIGCARTAENLVEKLNYLKQALRLNPQNKEAQELQAILNAFMNGKTQEHWRLPGTDLRAFLLSLALLALLLAIFIVPRLLPR